MEEEQQVPNTIVPGSSETKDVYSSLNFIDGIDIMDEMETILGTEDDMKFQGENICDRLEEWEEFPYEEVQLKEGYAGEEEEEDQDDDKDLKFNKEVLDEWSDRGSLWAEDYSLSTDNNAFMGEVPVMEEERTRREDRVQRYREKRQNRLFSKKIRYQVRKLNAEKRPRLRGRFVKRVPDKIL